MGPNAQLSQTRFGNRAQRAPQSDTLFLETDNGDNPAIELRDFRGFYPVTRVVFKATPDPAQPIWLYYGNPDAAVPHYDLTLVAGELLKGERTPCRGCGRKPCAETFLCWPNTNRIESLHFWGALALVVIVLLAIMSRFLPKPQKE